MTMINHYPPRPHPICLPCAIEKQIQLDKETMTVGFCAVCQRNRVVGEPKK